MEKILVVYYADTSQACADGSGGGAGPFTYPQQLMQAVTTAIGPLASSVQLLAIHAGDVGISSELNTQYSVSNLSQWCQVYDLRFMDQCNNQGYTAGQTQPDLVTNADGQLYRNYLAQGGSLFLQGEHHDFYVRNNGLMQMVNSVVSTQVVSSICGTYICPDVNTGTPASIFNAFTANYGFNTIYNNISGSTTLAGWYVGGIPAANYGSGVPLITVPSLSYSGGSGAMMLGWQGGALQGAYGAGKLVANFETNAFIAPLATTWATQALQNVYALQSGCQHYTVTKSFSPTSVCVGSSGTFTICATNTGTANLNNYSISDTIPTCLSYTSSSTNTPPSSTGNSGNLYWWTFPAIGAGQSACVTVNYNAVSFTCP